MKFGDLWLNFIPRSTYLRENGDRFIQLLSTPEFRPSHWGADPPHKEFDADRLAALIQEEEYPTAVLRRAPAPSWLGQFGYRGAWFRFTTPVAKKWRAAIFSWGKALADVFQPDFGVCQPAILPSEHYLSSSSVSLNCNDFATTGPAWLGARSFLGKKFGIFSKVSG